MSIESLPSGATHTWGRVLMLCSACLSVSIGIADPFKLPSTHNRYGDWLVVWNINSKSPMKEITHRKVRRTRGPTDIFITWNNTLRERWPKIEGLWFIIFSNLHLFKFFNLYLTDTFQIYNWISIKKSPYPSAPPCSFTPASSLHTVKIQRPEILIFNPQFGLRGPQNELVRKT